MREKELEIIIKSIMFDLSASLKELVDLPMAEILKEYPDNKEFFLAKIFSPISNTISSVYNALGEKRLGPMPSDITVMKICRKVLEDIIKENKNG